MKQSFSFSKNKKKKELSSAKRLFIGSTLIIISLFLLTSFFSYFFTGEIDQSNLSNFLDQSTTNSNSLGKIGAIISDLFIYKGFGVSSIIFAFLILLSALHVLLDLKKRNLTHNWLWGFYLMFFFSIFFLDYKIFQSIYQVERRLLEMIVFLNYPSLLNLLKFYIHL